MPIIIKSQKEFANGLMTEKGSFKSGTNHLAYCFDIGHRKGEIPGIIFVHAANGNRLGPHRMFVELARKFNRLGHNTLRFDFSGCGDSTGSPSNDNTENEVIDLLNAVDFFLEKTTSKNIFLLGISRGSRICLETMTKHPLPLKGMILLSTPLSNYYTGVRSFTAHLKQYFYKAKKPEYLAKLIKGRANIGQIKKTLTTALMLSRRYSQIQNKSFTSKVPVLFIYGSKDPLREKSSKYYTAKFRHNGLDYDCRFIRGANHSFFHYKWKEQIFEISKKWLNKIMLTDKNEKNVTVHSNFDNGVGNTVH